MPPVPELITASTESLITVACPGPEKTLIILDWDDTLLASSWLASNDLRLDSPPVIETYHQTELSQLEQYVSNFLERALTLGTVVLVTNAERGWVELSCERFLPRVSVFFPKVRVISARSKFEPMFPNQPHQWKVQAFREEISSIVSINDMSNIISIGDSHHEREALHVVTSGIENCLVKSVKFVERPGIEVLRRQLELIHGCIEFITQHGADLDLMLSQSLLFGNGDAIETASGTCWEDIEDGIPAVNGV